MHLSDELTVRQGDEKVFHLTPTHFGIQKVDRRNAPQRTVAFEQPLRDRLIRGKDAASEVADPGKRSLSKSCCKLRLK